MGMEIERKWLPDREWVKKNIQGVKPEEIVQGYLCRNPVVRIRKENDNCYLTYKGSGLLQHEEYNLPLNREAFEELLPKCSGKIIQKKRYRVPLQRLLPDKASVHNLTAEIDLFEAPEPDLILLEVEFPDISEADAFQAPAGFGPDVTQDPAYYNAVISK